MVRFSFVLTLAFMQTAAVGAVDLCLNSGTFQADNEMSKYCYSMATGAGLAGACPSSCTVVSDDYCFCMNIYADAASCEEAIPGATFSIQTCSAYTPSFGSTDAEWCTPSNNNLNSIKDAAEACCSDGEGACEKYEINPCSNDDFEPDSLYSTMCGTTAFVTDEACSSACTSASSTSQSLIMGGVCYCMNLDSPQCLIVDVDAMYYETTCDESVANAQYGNTFDFSTTAEYCAAGSSGTAYLAQKCCTSKESICSSGSCYSGSSEITVLRGGSGTAPTSMRVSEVKVGDRVLASSAKKPKPAYATITALPHSNSTGDFVHITMAATHQAKTHAAVVTPHHTFPECANAGGGVVAAKDVKAGDCLRTVDGQRTVAHVARKAAASSDETFSVELEGDRDRLAIGGILTHANPPVHGAMATAAHIADAAGSPKKHAKFLARAVAAKSKGL